MDELFPNRQMPTWNLCRTRLLDIEVEAKSEGNRMWRIEFGYVFRLPVSYSNSSPWFVQTICHRVPCTAYIAKLTVIPLPARSAEHCEILPSEPHKCNVVDKLHNVETGTCTTR